jgi:hypothetical protein
VVSAEGENAKVLKKQSYRKECKSAQSKLETFLDQKFEINQQNVKILRKIIDARQINVKSRVRLVSGIRNEESRANSSRNATLRADLKKQSEIAHRN